MTVAGVSAAVVYRYDKQWGNSCVRKKALEWT